MTINYSSKFIVTELKRIKQNGEIPQEVINECILITMPKILPKIIDYLVILYSGMSIFNFITANYASGVASLGPMITALYIRKFIRVKT